MTPYARFYGALDGDAFFQHMTSGKEIVCEQVDTVVTCFAPQANRECAWVEQIEGISVSWIGDAVSPRTVEEAVLEGFQSGREI
jgi:hypothetical protein